MLKLMAKKIMPKLRSKSLLSVIFFVHDKRNKPIMDVSSVVSIFAFTVKISPLSNIMAVRSGVSILHSW